MSTPPISDARSSEGRMMLITTCSCGHGLLDHFHHHMPAPQPCQDQGCPCENFDGYKPTETSR